MRIALVAGDFSEGGGTGRQAVALAGWLRGRGHEIDVYARSGPPEVRRWAFWPTLRRRLGAYDVVHGFVRLPGLTIFRAGGGAHGAWLDARDPAWRRPRDLMELWRDARAARSAAFVQCNSEMAADDVRRVHGLEAWRVRVIRNGVDGARFRPDPARRAAARERWRIPEGGRVALFFGSGFRRKGLGTAAAAFAAVARPADRLVVMGHDAHARAWLARVEAELGDRLVAHGPEPEPERWLPGADATILPTRYDAAANTTLEAMACGVPPVTSARDGNAALLPRALVVDDPRDVAGFGGALRAAWGEPGLGADCRTAALRWPGSRTGEAIEMLYREIVDG